MQGLSRAAVCPSIKKLCVTRDLLFRDQVRYLMPSQNKVGGGRRQNYYTRR